MLRSYPRSSQKPPSVTAYDELSVWRSVFVVYLGPRFKYRLGPGIFRFFTTHFARRHSCKLERHHDTALLSTLLALEE